jgi:hypothetical protein
VLVELGVSPRSVHRVTGHIDFPLSAENSFSALSVYTTLGLREEKLITMKRQTTEEK